MIWREILAELRAMHDTLLALQCILYCMLRHEHGAGEVAEHAPTHEAAVDALSDADKLKIVEAYKYNGIPGLFAALKRALR